MGHLFGGGGGSSAPPPAPAIMNVQPLDPVRGTSPTDDAQRRKAAAAASKGTTLGAKPTAIGSIPAVGSIPQIGNGMPDLSKPILTG